MNQSELQELLRAETERIEWKESARDVDRILRAVCALANDLGNSGDPGYLVIGVDKQGSAAAHALPADAVDRESTALASRVESTRLLPTPSASITAVDVEGRYVIVVTVEPYPVPPIVELDGTAWVRRGATTVKARDADLLRMRERRPERSQPFDQRPLRGATLSDLDTHRLHQLYDAELSAEVDAHAFPSFESWLTARQLGRSVDGVWTPNAAAVLVFGSTPQALVPGATIEFVRYAGTDLLGAVRDRRTVTGTVLDQLDGAWAQLNAHVSMTPRRTEAMVEAFGPEYPIDALRELVRNMVQHRMYEGTNAPGRIEWFDDRIEFSNPGGPFGQASVGAFGDNTDYRNPTLTKWLVHFGYVQQLGAGVRRVKLLLARNGHPPLGVETDGFTRVIVRPAQ